MTEKNFIVRHGLEVYGDANVSGSADVSGNVKVGGNLNVSGSSYLSGATTIRGNVSVNGNLNIASNTSLAGTLSVSGHTDLNRNLDVSGNTCLGGTLTTKGAASFNSTLTVSGHTDLNRNLDVSGNTCLGGSLTTKGATSLASTLDVKGNTCLGGTLTTKGAASFNSTLNVSGNTCLGGTLTTKGAASFASTLDVKNNTSLGGTLTVSGHTDLNRNLSVSGNVSIGGGLDVTGDVSLLKSLYVSGSLQVGGTGAGFSIEPDATFGGTLTVSGHTDLNRNLGVSGNTCLGGTLTTKGAASFNSTLTVSGHTDLNRNLDVSGNTCLGGSLTTKGAASFNSTVNIKSNTSVGGTLVVTNAANLNSSLDVCGSTSIGGNLTVTGNISVNGGMIVSGSFQVGGTGGSGVNIDANANIGGTLTVSGNTTLNRNVDISGGLQVGGTLSAPTLKGANHCGTNGNFAYVSATTLRTTSLRVTGGTAAICGSMDISGSLQVAGTLSATTIRTTSFRSTGIVQANAGTGGVALTADDGYGDANVTFNHRSGIPEQNGNAGRITVPTDATTSASFDFQLKSNVTNGTAVTLTQVLNVDETRVYVPKNLTVSGTTTINGSADVSGGLQVGGTLSAPTLTGANHCGTNGNFAYVSATTLRTTSLRVTGNAIVCGSLTVSQSICSIQLRASYASAGQFRATSANITTLRGSYVSYTQLRATSANFTNLNITNLGVTGNLNAAYISATRLTISGVITVHNVANQALFKTAGTNATIIHRNDGSNYYILLSNSFANACATYNSLRPFYINNANGRLYSNNGQTFVGGTTINANLGVTGTTTLSGAVTINGKLDAPGQTISAGTIRGGTHVCGANANFAYVSASNLRCSSFRVATTAYVCGNFQATFASAGQLRCASFRVTGGTAAICGSMDISGSLQVAGTLSASTLKGTICGSNANFAFVSGTTVRGVSANFTNITGSSITAPNVSPKSTFSASQNRPVGWYTIAVNAGNRASGMFTINEGGSGRHGAYTIFASHMYGTDNSNGLTLIHKSAYSTTPARYIRIKEGGTYDGALLQIYVDNSTNNFYNITLTHNFSSAGWILKNFVPDGTNPGNVGNFSALTAVNAQIDLDSGGAQRNAIIVNGEIYAGARTSQTRVWRSGDTIVGNVCGSNANFAYASAAQLRCSSFRVATTAYVCGNLQATFASAAQLRCASFRVTGGGTVTVCNNGRIRLGPNSTWGNFLHVGGNGNQADTTAASVVTTNGNLHLDGADNDHAVYLNWYGGNTGTYFGNGGGAAVGRIDGAGNLGTTASLSSPILRGANHSGTNANFAYASATTIRCTSFRAAGTLTVCAGAYLSTAYANWFRARGNTGFYFQDRGTGIRSPLDENSGTYGSVASYGAEGGWEGFSIGGSFVYMGRPDATYDNGLYDDRNNRWMLYVGPNSNSTLLYCQGTDRLITTTAGIRVNSVVSAGDLRASFICTTNMRCNSFRVYNDAYISEMRSTYASSGQLRCTSFNTAGAAYISTMRSAYASSTQLRCTSLNVASNAYLSGTTRVVDEAHATNANDYHLELFSNNTGTNGEISLRFHHGGRYWYQIRASADFQGFRMTQGSNSDLCDLTVSELRAVYICAATLRAGTHVCGANGNFGYASATQLRCSSFRVATTAYVCGNLQATFASAAQLRCASFRATGTLTVCAGAYLSTAYANWFRAKGATGFYFQDRGTGIRSPLDENSGQYGSVATYSSENGWDGFSLGGSFVYMGRPDATYDHGLYDDRNNRWVMYVGGNSNSASLRRLGTERVITTGSGIRVNTVVSASDLRASFICTTNMRCNSFRVYNDAYISEMRSTYASSGTLRSTSFQSERCFISATLAKEVFICGRATQILMHPGSNRPTFMWRNDGSNMYLLKSVSRTGICGTWDGTRPFFSRVSDGKVGLNQGLDISGNLYMGNGQAYLSARTFIIRTANQTHLEVQHSSSTHSAVTVLFQSRRRNSAQFSFLWCRSNTAGDIEFNLRGDGYGFCDGQWRSNGADYAEYFEWKDGNPNNENRAGYVVSMVSGDKIGIAQNSDHIPIGVVSRAASVVGNSAWNKWDGKYLKDVWGAYQRDESGNRIPNPDWDENTEYVSREFRREWDVIGLLGRVRIRKNQIVRPDWIKIKDVSDDVEEWLIK